MKEKEQKNLFLEMMQANTNDSYKRLIDDVESLSRLDDKELINWSYFHEGSLLMIYSFLNNYCVNYRTNFDGKDDDHLKDFFTKARNILNAIESNNTILK